QSPSILTYYLACLLRWLRLFPVGSDTRWFDLSDYPNLQAILLALETRDATKRAQAAEGLGPTPFSAPKHANPPEGSAI
ncbi:MAG: glutathione S-transferase, partial [Arenibacterium sp.]